MRFYTYVTSLIRDLLIEHRDGTAKSYQSTLYSAVRYFGRDATLEDIYTREQLIHYQSWLRGHNCCWNTVSFYMRGLQRFCNLARQDGVFSAPTNLFSEVFTGYDPTVKRALDVDTIVLLEDADFSHNAGLAFSRDLFMLSYYLHGISFVDLAFLRKSDMKNGMITYHRRKSGSLINTPINNDVYQIIRRYAHLTNNTPYLLPIILCPGENEYRQQQSALRSHNRRLKRIAVELGIKETLTSYTARHSWATNAYHFGVPISTISQALGHRAESVTRIYLSLLDMCVLENANEIIQKALYARREARCRFKTKVSIST